MPTTPPTISALPTPPSRDDSANFAARGDAFLGALPTFRTETNSASANVYANAVEAAASAVAALASQNAASASQSSAASSASSAAASAGAAAWASGTSYSVGAVVWSPATALIYRRTVAGAGVTDPSADPGNWALASAAGPQMVVVTAATQAGSANGHYIMTNAGASTLTLPAGPAAGDVVWVTVGNGRTDTVVAGNTKNIQGLLEDMTLDSANASVQLRYVNSTLGWRLV